MSLTPGSRRTSTEVSVVVSKHLVIGVQRCWAISTNKGAEN